MRNEITSFEDLDVFRRAYRLSLEIHRVSHGFPPHEQYGLGDQVRRASKSICANLAEGYGKRSDSVAEFKRFLMMSIGSCDEMRVWLRYCLDLGYIEENTWERWRTEYKDIARMLHGLRNSWRTGK